MTSNYHPSSFRAAIRRLGAVSALVVVALSARGADQTAAAATPPPPPDYFARSAATEKVATEFVERYFKMQFAEMELLSDPDISFDDPTANPIFGSEIVTGREAVFKAKREGFADINSIEFHQTRSFFAADYAVFEGVIDWSFPGQKAGRIISIKGMPLVIVLQLRDGRVISHRDYGDYRVFMKQYREQAAAPGKT